ncbi:MAG: carbonic anhydrase family protein [Proteobacteria bacterium]|nr:carbonic anhydrase family protein [Pseudomonadota bacterium]
MLSAMIAISSLLISTSAMASSDKHDKGHSAHWSYDGSTGPSHWGDLKKEYAACKEGKSQSPIDITGAVKADLQAIELNYSDSTLKVLNNGHAIQVNYGEGSYAVIGGKRYDLLQFHFHGPSENTIDGKGYPLEAHLVHKSEDGELAVIGVVFKEGKKNSLIQKIWDYIPNKAGHEMTYLGLNVNAKDLLPADKTYYHFSGSLTTPPCSEGVSWNVMTTPIEVSSQQMRRFSSFYKMNARPVQALNERVIQVSK